MMKRIGVFGGMFDPVHNGHMTIARHAVKLLNLDHLYLVPCHIPNHRSAAHCSGSTRMEMLALASKSDDAISADAFELESGDTSYTVSTMREFQRRFPEASLVFVLGADSLASIKQWHEWEALLDLCHFFAFSRAGHVFADQHIDKQKVVTSCAALFSTDTGNIWLNEDFQMAMSSTQVRDAIANAYLGSKALSAEACSQEEGFSELSESLDLLVLNYIKQNNLYRSSNT